MSTSIKTPDENPSNVESILSDMNGLPGYTIEPPGSRIETLLIMMDGAFASSIVASIDENFVMSITLKNNKGETIGTTQTIDLPLESVIVDGYYNSQTKELVFTLQNGNTIEISITDLVSGLQTELSESNKLNPAYIDYDSTHRAVSDSEKTAWNGKQSALSTAQLDAVNSGITAAKVTSFEAKQDAITSSNKLSADLVDDATTTNKFVTAADKNAWNAKQNAIDSLHMLDADLVDDTTATHKFATAAQLSQIETNKNNISSLDAEVDTVANLGAKNLLDLSNVVPTVPSGLTCTSNGGGTYTVSGTLSSDNSIKFAISAIEGDLILNGCPSGGGDSSYMQRITKNGTAVASTNDTGSGSDSFTMSGTGYELNFRFAAGTYTNVTFEPMLRPATISDPTYQPYALPNSDLTTLSAEDRASLVELVDGGAKNILEFKNYQTNSMTNLPYTINSDGSLTFTGSTGTTAGTMWIERTFSKSEPLVIFGSLTSTDITFRLRNMDNTDVAVDSGNSAVFTPTVGTTYKAVIRFNANKTYDNVTVKPMICTKAAWDISPTYQPYRPSEDEQNAQIARNTNDIANNGLKVVLSQQANSSTTYTYQMKTGDFSAPNSCGCYMISIITWGTTPTYSLYSVAYSGNHTDYTVITKIAGSDADVAVSSNTISVTSSGKVTIIAMK